MLVAIADDLSRIAGVDVITTWDARLGTAPFRNSQVTLVKSTAGERELFQRYAAECDAALVIAPELNGTLFDRCRIVEDVAGRLLGPRSRAVALCADKLRLAEHLRSAGICTIPTELCNWDTTMAGQGTAARLPFPLVVKPRDGAGSQFTRLVRDGRELDTLKFEFDHSSLEFIRQPFIAGEALSVALLFSASGREVEILPPVRQHLSDDGCFTYRGGSLPIPATCGSRVQQAALAACRTIPGLCGYAGVDLIVPADEPRTPIVVEINPRLTTSYLGYRALATDNLAEWLLLPSRFHRPVQWRPGAVEFTPGGEVTTHRPGAGVS